MAEDPTIEELISELRAHAHIDALHSLVRAAALDAAAARRADFASRFHIGTAPTTGREHVPEGLDRDGAQTADGNVLDLLENGAERPQERRLLGALLALGIAARPPETVAEEDGLGGHLVWLAAHTRISAFEALDAALGSRAEGIWRAVAQIAERPSEVASDFGQTEGLVAAVALASSSTPEARALRSDVSARVLDPAVRAVLTRAGLPGDDALLAGELSPPPYGAFLTTLLTVTLLLALLSLLRTIGRLALSYRRPAEMRLTDRGLEVSSRIELLGKVLRERATVVPLSNLARVTREVRYARLGLYAGLLALVLGTYFGMGLFVDGVRVPGGSLSLLGMAVLLMVVGLGADFVLSGASDNARGKCRLVVVPHKGRRVCIGALDPRRADQMLASIADLTAAAR
jgi:hypothetical protein